MYELFKTVHVIAAVIWVGGVIFSQANAAIATRSGEQAKMHAFISEQAWLGKHYYAPAAMTVLIAGIVMVVDSGWEFSDLWIVIGIALFAASVVIGMFLLGPKSEQLTTILEQKGMEDPQAQSLSNQLMRLSQVDLALLVLVVANMVVKPGV